MRYRKDKIKSKHHLIDGLIELLAELSRHPAVLNINPGVIEKCGYHGNIRIKVSCCYENSIRCLAKSHGAAQDVYVSCSDVEVVYKLIEEL